jgi:hypothetical protein
LPLSSFTNTCSIIVGPETPTGTANGQPSVFVVNSTCNVIAYGGVSGAAGVPGGGGGWHGVGSGATGGGPLPGNSTAASAVSTFGGGGGRSGAGSSGGSSIFGGGGGVDVLGTAGGASIFGGGGGSDAGFEGPSILGGSGSGGSGAIAPGGGGGTGSLNGGTDLTGARGEVRAWLIGPGPITSSYQPSIVSYALTPNNTVHLEGNAISFSVSTFGVADGTTLYYTLNNSSTAVTNDFTNAVNGSVVINGGQATFSLTANNSATIEADRNYFIDLRVGSTSGNIVAKTSNVTIAHSTKDISYRTVIANATSAATYTFNNVNIGAPSINRYVVFHGYSGGRRIETFTLNGETITPIVNRGQSPENAYYMKYMPTGTTANVTFFGGGANFTRGALSVWAVYNLTNATPVIGKVSGTDTINLTGTTILPGDIVIAASSGSAATPNNVFADSSIGLVTQFSNVAVSGNKYIGAHAKTGNTVANPSIVITDYNETSGVLVLR